MLEKILLIKQGLCVIKIKKAKGIYGTATKEDLNELKEEGIKAEILPWIKNTTN